MIDARAASGRYDDKTAVADDVHKAAGIVTGIRGPKAGKFTTIRMFIAWGARTSGPPGAVDLGTGVVSLALLVAILAFVG